MSARDSLDEPFVGSIALVSRFLEKQEQWLTVWDDGNGVYRLIDARRKSAESFRSCLHAEIETELGLSRKRDFLISGLSRAHHQAPIEWPDLEAPQWYVVQFFQVVLYGKQSRAAVERLANVRWQSLNEISAGRTVDGRPFCPKQRTLIERADILPASVSAA